MRVLLVIDMQNGSFGAETPRHAKMDVLKRINLLSSAIRAEGGQVIFIQHDGTKEQCYYPGFFDWEVLAELNTEPQDLFLNKTANDSFYQTGLRNLLENLKMTELIITGCATDFCVDTTVRTALTHDYEVTVVKDGHTTADRPHLNAEQIITHHNWMWENMTPTEGFIRLVNCEELLKELE